MHFSLDALKKLPLFELGVALGLYALSVSCFLNPVIAWDAWAYHLPFCSFLLNIGGGSSTYHLDPELVPTWMGFPKTAEFCQGFFWLITGDVRAVIIPNFLILLVYLWTVSSTMKIRSSLLVLAMMSCPMVLANYGALYIDFFTCTSLAVAFFNLTHFFDNKKAAQKHLIIGAIALVIAATCKYQDTIASFYLIALLGGRSFLQRTLTVQRVGLLVGLAICCTPVLLKNLALHENPFFPCRVQVAGVVLFSGPLAPSLQPNYGYALLNTSPARFIISATEIDWSYRGIPAFYDLDSSAGASPNFTNRGRTGGWNGTLFIVTTAIVLLYGVIRPVNPALRSLSINAFFMMALASVLPVSNELRYAIYVPIILYPLALALVLENGAHRQLIICLVTLFAVQSVLLRVASQAHFLKPDADNPALEQSLIEQARLHPNQFIYSNAPLVFRYSQAVTGTPYRISNDPADAQK